VSRHKWTQPPGTVRNPGRLDEPKPLKPLPENWHAPRGGTIPPSKFRDIPGQQTIDEAIMTEILARSLELVLHALNDAISYRQQMDDEDSAEAYAALLAELEEFSG
jgi:hypothetical protein